MSEFVNKIYLEPFYEKTEDWFQEYVDRNIKQSVCINCGKPYHDNLKVMWTDLHNGRIIWWCISHAKMWN
ncbi:MAG: hypothetical protein WC974_09855, partial [Thermoplasmata archaeon]